MLRNLPTIIEKAQHHQEHLARVQKLIPPSSKILVSDSFGPFFSHTHQVYLYRGEEPENTTHPFVLLSDQVSLWPLTKDEITEKIQEYQTSNLFKSIYSQEGWFLFQKSGQEETRHSKCLDDC